MKKNFIATLSYAAFLASCSLAPDYKKPEIAIPAAYKEEAGNWLKADAAAPANKDWWKAYGDDDLNALEDKVTSSNQDIKAALARYDEARADASVARAGFFPTLNANAGATREKTSKNVASPRPISQFNDRTVSGDFSYELDLWGKVRNSVAAGDNLAKASAADLAAMDLSMHTELAMDYFALRGEESTQVVVNETVAAYEKALQLTKELHKGGAGVASDVDQAETQLENAKTLAEETSLKRSQLLHAIAVLVGEIPSNFTIAEKKIDKIIPPIVPGIPSKLLEQRPDIASAILRVEAANADIGVARAAYLPDLSLNAVGGFESAITSNLFNAPSMFWSVGPSAAFNIFEGGKTKALTAKARAAYDESVANYRQTVLTAFQQVEDNLAAMRQLEKENHTQEIAVEAARRSLDQAKNRYKGGIDNYISVVVTQNTTLQAELNYIDLRTRHLTSSVLLIKALGGGWNKENL